jgi:hypothetical protein
MRIASSLSLVSCFLVIVVFNSSAKLQKRSYNKIIFFIALSDMLCAVGGMLGISRNGTFRCAIQTILTNLFPLASIFWTTVIAYFLFSIVNRTKLVPNQHDIISHWWLHMICWGLPTVVTLFPLITDGYGTYDGEPGWCFLKPRRSSPPWTYDFWVFASFFGWVYISLMLFVVLAVNIFCVVNLAPQERARSLSRDSATSALVRKILSKLMWYPLVILVCWSLITVYIVWDAFSPSSASLMAEPSLLAVTFSVPLFSGVLTSLSFFIGSPEARQTLCQLCSSSLHLMGHPLLGFRMLTSSFYTSFVPSSVDASDSGSQQLSVSSLSLCESPLPLHPALSGVDRLSSTTCLHPVHRPSIQIGPGDTCTHHRAGRPGEGEMGEGEGEVHTERYLSANPDGVNLVQLYANV